MEVRSSLEFRSNIYPITAKRRTLDDVAFVAAISDPKALVELEKASRRPPLSDVQEWQLKKGKPCLVGDDRYTPWGTKVINGKQEVVCLCDREDCVLFEKCMERHPSVVELASPRAATARESTPVEDNRGGQVEGQRLRLGVERRDVTEIASGAIRESTWTAEDDARLKDYFARYPREILYGFFPEREIADIEQRILKVCFSFARKQAADNDGGHGCEPSTSREGTSTSSMPSKAVDNMPRQRQREAAAFHPLVGRTIGIRQTNRKLEEKKRRQEELHKRPWDATEDDILARNYPIHGSNMLLWDEKLFGRKKYAIEGRAKVLGIRQRTKPTKENAARRPNPAKEKDRLEWEAEQIEQYYDTYGDRWGQWKRLIPWLTSAQLVSRAKELGHELAWSYSAKKQFLQNEGIDWSVDELDTLIYEYPLKPDWSSRWKTLLPARTLEERRELAGFLCLPSKDEITDLARKAARLT